MKIPSTGLPDPLEAPEVDEMGAEEVDKKTVAKHRLSNPCATLGPSGVDCLDGPKAR